jgi:hypothetical protein
MQNPAGGIKGTFTDGGRPWGLCLFVLSVDKNTLASDGFPSLDITFAVSHNKRAPKIDVPLSGRL